MGSWTTTPALDVCPRTSRLGTPLSSQTIRPPERDATGNSSEGFFQPPGKASHLLGLFFPFSAISGSPQAGCLACVVSKSGRRSYQVGVLNVT